MLRPTGLQLVERSALPPPIDVALAGFSIEDFDVSLRARYGIEGRPPKAGEGPISVIADYLEAIVPVDEFSFNDVSGGRSTARSRARSC